MSRDIIVTTPKSQRGAAEQEAKDCIAEGSGFYFRNLGMHIPKQLEPGDRCFYVENGAVRGFCVVERITDKPEMVCDTTGREFGPGCYVFMDATTWHWIDPIPMPSFQGWHYSTIKLSDILVLGGWLDPRPAAENGSPTAITTFWVCELCFKQSLGLPSSWELVWQSAICPECRQRATEDGVGLAVATGGMYAEGKPDPRADPA